MNKRQLVNEIGSADMIPGEGGRLGAREGRGPSLPGASAHAAASLIPGNLGI